MYYNSFYKDGGDAASISCFIINNNYHNLNIPLETSYPSLITKITSIAMINIKYDHNYNEGFRKAMQNEPCILHHSST